MKNSDVKLNIQLDEQNVPQKISWAATDMEGGLKDSKAFMLSIWDAEESETMKLDLWTSQLRVDEMDKLVFQSLLTMADTYSKATNNKELALEIRKFAFLFGEKTKLIKKK